MSALRPLLTARWALASALVLAASLACIWLGLWQFHRFEARSLEVDAITRNYEASPQPLAAVVSSPDARVELAHDYTVIHARGTYCRDDGCTLYVRGRTLDSQVGFWQASIFETLDGTSLIVVRGWVPSSPTVSAPAFEPPLPDGEVSLIARVRASEPQLAGRDLVPGHLQSVNAEDVIAQAGERPGLYRFAYAIMSSENGVDAASADSLRPLARPQTTRGPHLSYAVQWWVFAAFFPIGLAVSARRAVRDCEQDASDATNRVPSPRANLASPRSRPRSDEEEEDDILNHRDTGAPHD